LTGLEPVKYTFPDSDKQQKNDKKHKKNWKKFWMKLPIILNMKTDFWTDCYPLLIKKQLLKARKKARLRTGKAFSILL
jgi:hypothetical protein